MPREQAHRPCDGAPASTRGPPTTWSPSSRSSARPPTRCPTTSSSWSSGSATSSATGGSWCTRPTARRSTRPWALAINARLRERYGMDAQAMAADDGIVLRIPETDQDPPGADADRVRARRDRADRDHRGRRLGAVRLPLPRVRGPGAAAPAPRPGPALAAVAAAAAQRPAARGRRAVPVLPDRPRGGPRGAPGRLRRARADRAAPADLPSARLRLVDVAHPAPSPFARSLLFGYVAAFMYEGDSPIAERRAAALTLDQGLLAELLGRAELRELLDPEVLAEVESELQRLADDRQARDAEGIADLLRLLGPLSTEEVRARCTAPDQVVDWLSLLAEARRVVDGADGRARALGGRRGRRPAARRARRPGAAGHARRVHRAGRRPAGRPGRPVRPHPRPVRHRRRGHPARARRRGRAPDPGPARGARAGCWRASSGPPGPGPSGATPRCCAGCGAGRWPAAPRGRAGRAGHARPLPARLAARGLDGLDQPGLRGVDGVVTVVEQLAGCAVPACALESLVLPSRVRRLRSPRCSTSSPPPARCSGPATAGCRAPTAGSRCTSPTPLR